MNFESCYVSLLYIHMMFFCFIYLISYILLYCIVTLTGLSNVTDFVFLFLSYFIFIYLYFILYILIEKFVLLQKDVPIQVLLFFVVLF